MPVIIVFLFHIRSALIPILTLPLAVLATFIPMYYFQVSSNIMSLGGLALAIGVLVMLALYVVVVHAGLSTNAAIVLFGLFVASAMLLVMWRHRHNLATGDLRHLIAVERSDAKAAKVVGRSPG